MNLTKRHILALTLSGLLLGGCVSEPAVKTGNKEPDILIIHENGDMEFKNRLLDREDVVIYPDGFGGEKAAVKIKSLEPLHPAFYRDSIIVQRRSPDLTEITANN